MTQVDWQLNLKPTLLRAVGLVGSMVTYIFLHVRLNCDSGCVTQVQQQQQLVDSEAAPQHHSPAAGPALLLAAAAVVAGQP